MNKKLVKTEYEFSVPYVDSQERELFAKVLLSINMKTKTFNITPSETKNDFVFMNTSQHNWQMWMAVAKAIENATAFAAQFIKENE